MRRCIVVFLLLAGPLTVSGPAWAGGWAVTTIVDMPDQFVRGETHEVVFEVRQHGVRLATDLEDVAIVLHSAEGDRLVFPATLRGTQWVAGVTVPATGTWTWSIQPGWFATVELGTLPTSAPAAPAPSRLPQLGAGIGAIVLGAALLLLARRPQTLTAQNP